MSHARRTHAGLGQPVVEPRGGPVAEVGADRLVNRREHLEQDEHGADEGERTGEAVAVLHGADEHAHRDGEHRRQHAAQDEHDPPGDGEQAVAPSAERRRTSIRCARADATTPIVPLLDLALARSPRGPGPPSGSYFLLPTFPAQLSSGN